MEVVAIDRQTAERWVVIVEALSQPLPDERLPGDGLGRRDLAERLDLGGVQLD
jgi:hypothetical protein